MKAVLTKFFYFSASFSGSNKIHAHNYVLGVTVRAPDEAGEEAIERRINSSLIQKLESRDLGTDVEFLRGLPINEPALLKNFWKIIQKEIRPVRILSLSLQRDKRALFTYSR